MLCTPGKNECDRPFFTSPSLSDLTFNAVNQNDSFLEHTQTVVMADNGTMLPDFNIVNDVPDQQHPDLPSSLQLISPVQESAVPQLLDSTTPQQSSLNRSGSARRSRCSTASDDAKLTRKRSYNPSTWKAVSAKRALDFGQAHISARNRSIKERQMRAGCHDACRICKKSRLGEG